MPRAASTTTVDRILDGTIAQMALHGIRRTTMDDIAQAAGVSRPTLYEYFANKQAIVGAAISRELDRFLNDLEELARREDDPEDRLVTIVTAAYLELREHALLQRMLAAEQQALLPFLTGAAPALEIGQDWAARQLADARGASAATDADRQTAEMLVRVMHSFVLSPPKAIDLSTPEAIAAWVRRWLAPWLAT